MAKPHFVGLIGKPGARLPAGMNTVAKKYICSLGRIVVTIIEAGMRCFDLWQGVKEPISYMYKSLLGHGVWTHLILQTHLKISLWRFRGQLTWDLGVKVVQPFYTNFKFFPQTFIDFIMPSVWRVLVSSGNKLDRIAKMRDSGAIGLLTIQKEMITDNMFLFEQITDFFMVFIPQQKSYC